MTRFNLTITAAAIAFVVVGTATQARRIAANPSISFDPGQPRGCAGKVDATGTYVNWMANGRTVMSVDLMVAPAAGGLLRSIQCSTDGTSWGGTVSSLPAGNYNCRAVLKIKKVNGVVEEWSSPFAFNVPVR